MDFKIVLYQYRRIVLSNEEVKEYLHKQLYTVI